MHKDGRLIPVSITATLLKDSLDRVVGVSAVMKDLTERKKAEEALKESEERVRSIVETASDAIISTDSSGNIVSWNRVAGDMFGYSADEAVGKSITILIPERFRKAHQSGLERVVSTGKTKLIGGTVELAGLRRDGSEVPLDLSLAKWEIKGGVFFTGIIRDVTERKHAERKLKEYSEMLEEKVNEVEDRTRDLKESQVALIQADKMAGLGTLAGGIAHEVNNPLASILTYAQLMQSKAQKGTLTLDGAVDYAARIEGVTKHCKATIQNLLQFSREPREEVGPIPLREAIEAAVSLISHQLELQGIKVTIEGDDDVVVKADRNHIMQVFLNLLTNAKDAMPEGGSINIETHRDGGHIQVAVSDTGTGIAPGDLNRIFEPFFTRKEPGKGTGIGLYLCYQIIEKLSGTIKVESERGRGTRFTIGLPTYGGMGG